MSRPEVPKAARILLMVYSLNRGGAERVTVELARNWTDEGHQVTILTLGPPETDFFEVPRLVQHVRLSMPTDQTKGLLGSLVSNAKRIVAIRRELRSFKPDVALGMMSASAILLALAGLGLPGRRYGSERTYPPMLPLRRGKGLLRSVAYGLLKGVVCQTRAAADWVSGHTMARATPIVPNPVVLPLPRQAPEILPDTVVKPADRCLLAVGRFSEEKQFGLLIAVFGALVPRFADWRLVIIGDGPDRAALEDQVIAQAMSDRVFLPGACGNVSDWYERADLFAMTSRFEGFPNVLLEAMAHGTPAVAFNCLAGPSDIVDHGANGILVPPNNSHELEESLARLMADTALRASFAVEARAVAGRFSPERVMGRWDRALGIAKGEWRASQQNRAS